MVSGQASKWQNAPADTIQKLDANGYITGSSTICTNDSYAVNTVYSANKPVAWFSTDPTHRLPSQPVKTIGDTLTASNVTWAWYSKLFDQALTYQTNASSLTSAQTSFFKANFNIIISHFFTSIDSRIQNPLISRLISRMNNDSSNHCELAQVYHR